MKEKKNIEYALHPVFGPKKEEEAIRHLKLAERQFNTGRYSTAEPFITA